MSAPTSPPQRSARQRAAVEPPPDASSPAPRGALPSALRGPRDAGAGARYPRIVGVLACDEYLFKFQRCMDDRAPADQRPLLEASLESMRRSWVQAAHNEAGRRALGVACRTALDTVRKVLAGFSCSW